ncbi:CAP domain-containing protein [Wukongibacter baidiensis]|uniref:CAP domain-containing protein n=1 Tax=Wukongibacter baidiensis TaxID=1723361 RepID=UPI003D7F360E
MLKKRLVTLGLSTVISASLLVPVNALTPTNTCQARQQDMKPSLENFQANYKNNTYKKYKTYRRCTPYKTSFTKEDILARLNACLDQIEEAYEKGMISEDRYDRIKGYLGEKIEKVENWEKETTKPDTGNETPAPETGNETPNPDTGTDTDTNKPDQTTNQGISAKEQQMVNLINEARRQNGVKPLIVDTKLTELARMKSKDMIDNNYFSHNSPTYGSPFDMLKNFGVSYRSAGENIAGNQTVERAHESLMNSPGHRRNILSPDYTHIGIGIQEGGRYGSMFTQMFIKK